MYQLLAIGISIHALLAESDITVLASILCTSVFLSTLSLRRATEPIGEITLDGLISIHALLAESDGLVARAQRMIDTISIHALLAESDPLQ